jgi:hypothetical protein
MLAQSPTIAKGIFPPGEMFNPRGMPSALNDDIVALQQIDATYGWRTLMLSMTLTVPDVVRAVSMTRSF